MIACRMERTADAAQPLASANEIYEDRMKTTAELQARLAKIQNPLGRTEIEHAELIELIEEILRLRKMAAKHVDKMRWIAEEMYRDFRE